MSHALYILLCARQADDRSAALAKKPLEPTAKQIPRKNFGSPKPPDATPLEGEGVAFLRVAHTPYMDLLFCF